MGLPAAPSNVVPPPPNPDRFEPLSGFSPEQADLFRSKLIEQSVPAGEAFIRAGEIGDCLFIVRDGQVVVRTPERHDGTEVKVLARLGPGSVVGEMALLNREPRNANVVAMTDCSLCRLAAKDFDEVCAQLPSLKLFLTRLVAHRLSWSGSDVLARRIGGYTVISRLGEGGMGWVFRAVSEGADDVTRQQVALKMLPHTLVTRPGFLEKFRQEANVMARLRHENIVTLYETIDAYGTMFMVLEYVRGMTVREWVMQHGRPKPDDVRRIARATARALCAAHAVNVIHRDIKPDNLMLREDGVVKLMDFGIAVPIIGPAVSLGGVSLTPVYGAPELFVGDRGDPAADFYSLGVMTYELLANRPPFSANTFEEWAHEHMYVAPPPLRHWCSEVPPDLERFVAAALTKDPRERWALLEPMLGQFGSGNHVVQDAPTTSGAPRLTGAETTPVFAPSSPATPSSAAFDTPTVVPSHANASPQTATVASMATVKAKVPSVVVAKVQSPPAKVSPSSARMASVVGRGGTVHGPLDRSAAAPMPMRPKTAPTATVVKDTPPAAPPGVFRIVALWVLFPGETKERAFLMTKPLVIGRDEPADVIIPDHAMSRRHAELSARSDGLHVRDLNSSNGTLLNSHMIHEASLKPGDKLRLGFSLLTYTGETPQGVHFTVQPTE